MENLLSAKLKEVNKTLSDKTSSLETTVNDLTDGVSLLADVVSEIPKMVEDKINKIELKEPKEPKNGIDGKQGPIGPVGPQGPKGDNGQDGIDGLDGSPDSPEDIVNKLNTQSNAVDWKVLKNFDSLVNQDTLKSAVQTLENQTRYLVQKAQNSSSGGLQVVTTDGTLTGDGTSLNPLGFPGVAVDGTTIIGDGVLNPLYAVTNQTGKQLLSGGISWSGTGYVYDVSALYYTFDGVFYTSSPTQVTMAAADPTNNRFDAVVVDITGTITVITGTPSSNPAYPTIPDDQLVVGYVLVEAATTSPTILQDTIYLDNAEWTTSTYTTGFGSIGSIDFNSTNAPYQGTKCAQASGTNLRLGMKFTRSTSINAQTFAYVQIWARLSAAVATNKNLYVRFDNSLGNPVGNTISLFNYGMSRTIVNTWQLVLVPIAAFGSITNIKGLRAIMAGGTLSNTATWALDFMLLTQGIPPQGAIGPIYLSPSNTLYSSGAATGATATTDSIMFGNLSGFHATNANSSIFLGANSGKNATNANNSEFIGLNAGNGAMNADNSQFIGTNSGLSASSAYSSVFIGTDSGNIATNAYQSVFIGRGAGQGATNASDSFFMGYLTGYGATAASASAFLGSEAGSGAINASSSVFAGYQAGKGAVDALGSIYIGTQAGLNSTSTAPGILIGYSSSTGGFNNSIAIGTAATNTADNQLVIGSSVSKIELAKLVGTGAFSPQVGTTGERPGTPTAGMIRFNTTTSKHEGYDGTTWNNFY